MKKRKDLNKYKQQSVNRTRPEVPQDRISMPLSKLNNTKSTVMSKVNRGERLTVNRGLFEKSKKSKLAFRDTVNRSEQAARLNEDLDALIPSCNDTNDDSLQYLDEQNNNIPPPLSPNVDVIWETQPDSDHSLPSSPAQNHKSTNHNRSHRHPTNPVLKISTYHIRSHRSLSPAQKPTSTNQIRSHIHSSTSRKISTNQIRSHLSLSPVHKHISTNQSQSNHSSTSHKVSTNQLRSHRSLSPAPEPSSNHSREKRPPRSRSSRSLADASPDSYPRTRAYVNAQRERLDKFGVKAFELSSESEVAENEQESTCSDKVQLEMINKYIELMGYMEKKFDPIKREVFKDAPCKDYFKKLKSELWESYQDTGRKAQEAGCGNPDRTPCDTRHASTNIRDDDIEILSLCSDDSDRSNLLQQPPPQPREFVFSPKLTQSPERSNSPHHSPASTVFPHNGAPCGSYENRSFGIAHGLCENENTYEDTGWRPRDFNHPQLCAYRDNHSASWANPSSLLHKSRLQSPEQTAARKRRRPNSNESNPYGFDSNQHGFEMNARDFDSNRERLDSSSCAFNFNRHELESNPRNMDWQSAYRCGDSQGSSLQYSERSYVLSPNSRARDQAGVQPRRTDYGNRGFNKGPISVITLDPDDIEDPSPPMRFYPRKLF